MMHLQTPHRLFPHEYPSTARLVQLVLCDDNWARIDAYRMAYEHVHGVKLGEREAEAHIRQKAAIQTRLTSFPPSRASAHGLDVPPNLTTFDQHIGGTEYPLSNKFSNLSLGNGDLAQPDSTVTTPTSSQRPRMERASTSTSGVSVVVPSVQRSAWDTRETATRSKKDSLATLASSSSETNVGPPSALAPQDCEYKHWGRLDDPDSVWNNLHVERPQLNQRRRFSSYKEYKKIRNQPMKDNDQLFKKRMKQSFAKGEMEALSVNGSDDVGEDEDRVEEEHEARGGVAKEGHKRQILLVKRKGNLAGQNL